MIFLNSLTVANDYNWCAMTERPRSWLFLADKFKKSCSMFFKNLLLSFSFAESTVLRLQVKCKTFFVVILNGKNFEEKL